ncbi:hypothetical protein K505DRAFT_12708 [Melanomma pulvis-pyrius CBS 109.77]|uniref:Uncharacterized protein n=1 Tax=Melanomma pulvis-pyrius CBS 109.77 TaxID=1314802 RepID=A0A6A6XHA4_9PLEO|nr:hypothetical protein K505DRAFT_12708 [Melanomma pulvis-pyrius CBS 109.77]
MIVHLASGFRGTHTVWSTGPIGIPVHKHIRDTRRRFFFIRFTFFFGTTSFNSTSVWSRVDRCIALHFLLDSPSCISVSNVLALVLISRWDRYGFASTSVTILALQLCAFESSRI